MKKWLIGLGLGFIGLLACGLIDFKYYAYSQRDEIYEAVVRYVNANPNDASSKGVIFVQIERQEPSPAFLRRFQGGSFSVRPASQGKSFDQAFPGSPTTDISTGEKGIALKLLDTSWLNPAGPIVRAGADNYMMVHDYGAWRVENVLEYSTG